MASCSSALGYKREGFTKTKTKKRLGEMALRLAERHLRTFASGGSKWPAAVAGGAKMLLACQLRSIAFYVGCQKVAQLRKDFMPPRCANYMELEHVPRFYFRSLESHGPQK